MRRSFHFAWMAGTAAVSAAAAMLVVETGWPGHPAQAEARIQIATLPEVPAPAVQVAEVALPAPDLPAPLDLGGGPTGGFAQSGPVGGLRASVTEPVLSGEAMLPGVPAPAHSPGLEIVRREAALRDPALSRITVLPPPRPSFREAALAAGPAPRERQIVELKAPDAGSAWPEPASTGSWSWASLPVVSSFSEPKSSGKPLQSGMASWYGPGFHGRRTASGERFDQNAMTAAHRTLPFGTRVRVIDERTGKSVVVRINDRGPFAHGRIIDLSKGSAQAIGILGTGRVKIVSAE